MSERYSRLYSLPENLYIEGSPLLIKAGVLLKDTQTGKTIAQLKFANICAKTVKAVFVAVNAFDIAGNKLNGVDEYQYLDLAAIRSDKFGQKNAILLPDNVTRKIDCFITKVIFADDSVWEAPADSIWEPLKERTLRKPFDDAELEKQFHIEYGENFKYEFESVKDLWYCTCGAINHKEEETCHICKKSLALYTNLDITALEEKKNARLEAERIAADKKAEEEKRIAEENAVKAKKTKKLLAIILPVITVIIAAIIIVNSVIIPNSKYNAAVKLMESGNYEEAISAFESFDGYRNSEEMINDCKYNIAIELMDTGMYEEAISAFEALDGHKDSVNKIDECNSAMFDVTYIEAIALMNAGNYKEARSVFEELGKYKDSIDKAKECSYNIAIELMNDESFKLAIPMFEKLGKFSDSAAQLDKCMSLAYESALKKINNGDINSAIGIFTCIRGYKDVNEIEARIRFEGKWKGSSELVINFENNTIEEYYYSKLLGTYTFTVKDYDTLRYEDRFDNRIIIKSSTLNQIREVSGGTNGALYSFYDRVNE